MNREIAVANVEPDRLGQFAHRLQAEKSVALHSPTAFPAEQARQRIGDRVQIRRNVKAPPLQVVTGVHHKSQFLGRGCLPQSFHKLCSPGTAGEHNDHAALRA